MRLEKVFAIKWASLYPMYLKKAEAKGRTQAELDQVKADIISGTITIASPSQPK